MSSQQYEWVTTSSVEPTESGSGAKIHLARLLGQVNGGVA